MTGANLSKGARRQVASDPGPLLAHQLLDRAATALPQARAVTDKRGCWDYRTLRRNALRVAAWLASAEVERQSRVVVRLSGRREYLAVLYGCLYHGAIAVPVSADVKPFQLSSIMRDAEPVLEICDDVQARESQGRGSYRVIGLSELWASLPGSDSGIEGRAGSDVCGEDLALIIFTSGSASSPKGVACPHRAVAFAANAITARVAYTSDDVVLTCLPLSFDYGLYQLFLCAAVGAELVLVSADDKVGILKEICDHRATVVPVVPTLASMLVQLATRDARPTALRLITNTGAALDPALATALRHRFRGASVVAMYGLTECKRVSVAEPDEDLVRPYSVGRPVPGTEAYPVDEDGCVLPPGVTGQLVVRGPHVMAGYWRSPELSAQRFRTDPRTGEVILFTGDFGYRDTDGHLYFTGRRDDIFKRNGYRVSTVEIEAAALDSPGVDAAVAIPPNNQHDLTIVVVGEVVPDRVLAELAARLEPAKVPSECLIVDALPVTSHGKVDRRALVTGLEQRVS